MTHGIFGLADYKTHLEQHCGCGASVVDHQGDFVKKNIGSCQDALSQKSAHEVDVYWQGLPHKAALV